jgi:hypothetical protein
MRRVGDTNAAEEDHALETLTENSDEGETKEDPSTGSAGANLATAVALVSFLVANTGASLNSLEELETPLDTSMGKTEECEAHDKNAETVSYCHSRHDSHQRRDTTEDALPEVLGILP